MTSMKIVQFSIPPPPLVYLRPKFFHPLNLRRPVSNEPHASSNDNQSVKRKHNPRMTIQGFPYSEKEWGSKSEILGVGEFFYRVIGTGGVILTIRTFFKAKNSFL